MLGHIPQPAISNLEKAVMWYEGLRASGLDSSLSQTRDKRFPVAATGSGPLAGKLALSTSSVRMSVSVKKNPTRVAICCRKGDPFQAPKLGSCLTLRDELSEGTHVLTKQEILMGKGTQVESRRVREHGRLARVPRPVKNERIY